MQNTELILTSDNRIYHLDLKKGDLAENIILVGDPNRVAMISKKFDIVEIKRSNREFITHTGYYSEKRISIISTGIGVDNIDIVINEIDALFNVDFQNKRIEKNKKKLNIIRLGTTGSLQKNIKVNSFIISKYALGFDGLAHFYKSKKSLDTEIFKKFKDHIKLPNKFSEPYFIKASDQLIHKFKEIKSGITLTAIGFYGPQQRHIRLKPSLSMLEDKIYNFKFKNNTVTNYEMETSALYYLCKELNHNVLTICVVLANRISRKHSKDSKKAIEKLIDVVLNKI